MTVESIPSFTDPAAKLWATIPADTKKLLLANVWCSNCKDGTTITNFTGVVKGGDRCWRACALFAVGMWLGW
jgi:hypothetical protein